MKKPLAVLTTALAAALGLLVLAACANPFINPLKRDLTGGETGLVRIETGAARTALPDTAVFDHYEYTFYHEGGSAQSIPPLMAGGDEFALVPGKWEVAVKAYAESGPGSLAAEGNAFFSVSLGDELDVIVTLRPVVGSGTGTLNYAVTHPAAASVLSFTLTLLAGSTDQDLASAAVSGSGSLAGSVTVNAGYYLAKAVLMKDGITAGKSEVVHIGASLTTNLAFAFTDDDFRAILVFSNADDGPGSLREAIANADAGATIMLDLQETYKVITLTRPLVINKNLAILGGGATLTRSNAMTGSLVSITNNAVVSISRAHFRGGKTTGNGGAVSAAGFLTLESCVFSDNQANGNGGAVYATATLTARGSTFYRNSAGTGGAIYGSGQTLAGNLFYGNTAANSPAVYAGAVSDYDFNGSDTNFWSGVAVANGNRLIDRLPLSPVSFKPLGGLGENGAEGVMAARPAGYPVVDFQGRPLPSAGAAAGALQTPTAAGGYVLDYAAAGPGTVSVSSGAVDEDGLTGGAVRLSAVAAGGEFRHWLVNGEKAPEQSAVLALTINAHATVRAVFYARVSASSDNVPGSLRYLIADAMEGSGVILPEKESLVLYGDLAIGTSIVIEGNGATIHLSGRHIVINGAATEVKISRVHFQSGAAAGTIQSSGGAIQNGGILTVESCVFSGNQTSGTSTSGGGGAIYSTGALTVVGSTFYRNAAGGGYGGAIRLYTGSAVLQGNLFWENTAASYPVASSATNASIASLGFNISDKPIGTDAAQSGWTSAAGDAQALSLPFSSVSFKPFAGGAADKAIAKRPAGYPTVDFYGTGIPAEHAAAGAAQGALTATGYVLDYAAQGPGAVELTSGGPADADGFVPGGSVTLTATPANTAAAAGTFKHWIVDGVQQPTQSTPNEYAFTLGANTTVRGVFAGTYTVSSGVNGGPGSFREALALIADGDTINLDGKTITLTEPLDAITRKFTLQGNGATLTQNGFVPSNASQLMSFNDGAEVSISRVHFTGGRSAPSGAGGYDGGAIYNDRGKLTFESCVFSDNQGDDGGAIYTQYGMLTIYGCTFYGNRATGSYGAAAIGGSGINGASLVGNVFWGNTPVSEVVYLTGGGSPYVVSGSFNVSDGTLTGVGTPIKPSALPIVPRTFRPFAGGGADNLISVASRPAGYPTVDFEGVSLSASSNVAAGAAQTPAAGYYLDYGAVGPGRVSTSASPDSDNLVGGSPTFTATADPGKDFLYWTVNGTPWPDQTPPTALTIAMDGHKTVRGVFGATWTVTSAANDGAGSLRDILANVEEGDRLVLTGQTIVLTEPLPAITKRLFIEGNAATLTQSGFIPDADSQLLTIRNAEVRIRRLHFTGGRATNDGAAIRNINGNLSLESCVLSDNRTSGASASGGALYSDGVSAGVAISGCAFYGNAAGTTGGQGGAVYKAGGTLALTGNIFWGNTAATYSVVRSASGTTPVSGGFNISDKADGTGTTQSGWVFAGDTEEGDLPLSPATFKPLSGEAAYQAITTRPLAYPTVDFYGNAIPGFNAMAGAAQEAISPTGYYLDCRTQGAGSVTVVSGTEDSSNQGFYSSAVTLTATNAANGAFTRWIVNGTDQGTSPTLNLTMDGHKTVVAVFATAWTVTSVADSGDGSLREVLAKALDGDSVIFPPGQTITLTTPLPAISTSLAIQGNGATLTQSGFRTDYYSQLLYISSATAEVRVSRLHFKGGRATDYGAAIRNEGKLTLESCVLSDNRTSASNAYGGAIYTSGSTASLILSGCTFYGNTAGTTTSGQGGAVYKGGGTLALTGNIFWENTAASYSVVRSASGTAPVSGGFNISDKPSGTNATQSGWTSGTEDTYGISAPPFAPRSFRPFALGAADGILTTLPSGYPAVDFYGEPITTPADAGAAQGALTGYILDYAAVGPGTVSSSPAPSVDGLYSGGGVTLTAAADAGKDFFFWTVDGARQPVQTPANRLTLTMDGHQTVRGVFGSTWTVTSSANDGAGSLRQALNDAAAGDRILFQTTTVTLTAPLGSITKSLVIDGNGATVTQSGFTASATSQLLYISSATAEVRVSRLHFKGGRATDYGAAINNAGILSLESCVFSDNRTSASNAYGGAIYTSGSTASLTLSGCTFYGNTAGTTTSGQGGAVYQASGTLALTGNIFWENTAYSYSVVRPASGTVPVSGGCNIADKPIGAGSSGSGWALVTGDAQTTSLPFHTLNFRPLSTGAAYQAIDARPAGYPALDFNGDPIPAKNAMAGAVQTAIVSSGYILDYAAVGAGAVAVTGGSPDNYGLYTGEVTLTATEAANSAFIRWTVDGTNQGTSPTLTLTMNGHKVVRAVFSTAWQVSSGANSGEGTLREALSNAADGDSIVFQTPTVTLSGPLPEITKSLIIVGNGATLTTGSGFITTLNSQLLHINASTAAVNISRLHFTGGRATLYGGAIRITAGTVTLESCILSDNQTSSPSALGGAIYVNSGTTTISGCTFYGNAAGPASGTGWGGAVYNNNGTLKLRGNLFWANTAGSYTVAYGGTSQGYNIADKPIGAGGSNSGWTFTTGDAQATGLPLWVADGFKPLSSGAAYQAIAERPSDYPTEDFYGNPIPEKSATAGAVQTPIITTGYGLDYAAQGQGQVQVSSGTPDGYGFYSGSVTLTATSTGGTLMDWTVNGTAQGTQASTLTITMDGHKTVRALFATVHTVTSAADSGTGSLRKAVSDAAAGDYITLAVSQPITLASSLTINKSLAIEGNGATLTQSGISNSQLLIISSTVRISRLHFKGSRASDYGAAIKNTGNLTLESCIFSDNRTTSGSAEGGAIDTNTGSLTVSGCTFYDNSTGNYGGGAIYIQEGAVTLTGNIFVDNTGTATTRCNMVQRAGGTLTTGGYNVSDVAGGTAAGESGWTFKTGADADKEVTDITFDAAFKPSSASLPIVPSLPSGFPTTYFDGTARGANSTPGAMPKK